MEDKMKCKKLKLSTVFLLGLGITGLKAQVSINAIGSNVSGSGGSVSYSVGQVVCQTHNGTNGSVAQGVQQPIEISAITRVESKRINLTISAYPNPTNDYLTLRIDGFEISNLSFQLYEINGKLIESKNIEGKETDIIMSNLLPETYFLKVIQDHKDVGTFKIIKN